MATARRTIIARSALMITALVLMITAGGGCALVPHRGESIVSPPGSVRISSTSDDSSRVAMTEKPDSTMQQTAPREGHPAVVPPRRPHSTSIHPVSKPAGGERGTAPLAETTPPGERAPSDASSQEEGDRGVSVGMSDAVRSQLIAACNDDLASAEKSMDRARARGALEKQPEKMETVAGLIAQSREALEREDFSAAANLAHKARVLADELQSQ
jgi:hypothetical protein